MSLFGLLFLGGRDSLQDAIGFVTTSAELPVCRLVDGARRKRWARGDEPTALTRNYSDRISG